MQRNRLTRTARDPRPGMKHCFQFDPPPLCSFCPLPPSPRESKSNPSLFRTFTHFQRCPEDHSHRRYKSRSHHHYITTSSPSPHLPLHIIIRPLSAMQQYNLRPVSELSRSPSSRSSGSPLNHHDMSPPSSHLPPIQHASNGAQAPPRRPISPSSLPRKLYLFFFFGVTLFLFTGPRPRCFQWPGHSFKELPPTSHRARPHASLPSATTRAAHFPQAGTY